MRQATIAILTHALQGKAEGYFIAAVAQRWEALGHRVLVHQGLGTPPAADLAILHVDLTRVPPEYVRLGELYPRLVNGRALDVRKRRVSRQLVSRDDAWAGPVLVKTDANAFGRPDRRTIEAQNRQRGQWLKRLKARLAAPWQRGLGDDYPVYADKTAVPRWVWSNPDLVVERFLPQRQGDLFVCNSAFVMGDHGLVSSYATPRPVAKIADVQALLPLEWTVPAKVQEVRHACGLDFGKIDYVVHDGEVHVLDVNPTPHLGLVWDKSERLDHILGTLASGLESFLVPA